MTRPGIPDPRVTLATLRLWSAKIITQQQRARFRARSGLMESTDKLLRELRALELRSRFRVVTGEKNARNEHAGYEGSVDGEDLADGGG